MSNVQGVKINNYQRPVNLLEISSKKNIQEVKAEGKASFKEMFSREMANSRGVVFSKHASERLFSRGIELSEEKLAKLADAIDKAELKGSKETLVLSDDAAFVVAVDNRTVVTVFDNEKLREGVVTSIDSAVII